jgi:hypothetical protein
MPIGVRIPVDSMSDRHRPGVGDAGQLKRLVHLGDQLVGGHARPPLLLGPQVDHCLEHLDRGRVGRRDGTPGLAEDRLDFRKTLDDPVLRLQQLGGLGHRHAGQPGRHVEQRPFVQRRHELGAEARCRDPGDDEDHHGEDDGQHAVVQHQVDDRTVDPDQEPVDRVLLLRHHLAADEQQHQHRHQRDR